MRLPNAAKAVVERRKILDYLLNPAHPDNGGKAQFFDKLGFRRKEWKVLAEALRMLAGEVEVTQHMKSSHGQKYVISGRIHSPVGKSRSCKRFGLSTEAGIPLGWLQHIRTKNERRYDQRI